MKKVHHVSLSSGDKQFLTSLVRSGRLRAGVFRRANTLLKASEGLIDAVIAQHVGCCPRTVTGIRKRFCAEGLNRTLWGAPRSGRAPVYTAQQEAKIVALACTSPPAGDVRWTLSLLVEAARREGILMQRNKIWTVLKKHDLKPWRKKNVVRSFVD